MKSQFTVLACVLLGCAGAGTASQAAEPVTKEIKLFNGKDLANFYTYLGAMKRGDAPIGKNKDPEKVFSVVDGMLRISGQTFGGLITEKEYENYHLITEFKWGEKTWPPREKDARDSGILLHCVGEDGAAFGFWQESVECQMIEGGTGDLILIKGKTSPKFTITAEKRGKNYWYDPKAKPLTFKSGRISWLDHDADWQDVKGFRGKNDVEKPVGEWNTLECICRGDKITIILNGKKVNEATRCTLSQGKILLQSEGAEVFFRRVDLLPLAVVADAGSKEDTKAAAANMLTFDNIAVDFSYFNKAWGLKLKSLTLEKNGSERDLKFTFEFDRDLEPDDLTQLQAGFAQAPLTGPGAKAAPSIWYHFFDQDNVSMGKVYFDPSKKGSKFEGEITGVRGDAFRVTIANVSVNENAKKLVARPGEKADK
jgi:hypothetical protein